MTTLRAAAPMPEAPLAPDAKPMRGPSALGGGFRRFLDLTWMIGVTEYRLTYFGSALGYLWSLMRPLMFFGVLYVVFSQIVDFGDDIPNYPMMLLMNIVLFSFFQDVTERSVTAVVNSEALVRKMHFPRLVIPLSVVMTGLLNLVLNLLAVAIFFVAYGLDPQWTWLLFPVVLLPLVVFTAAAAMLLSALYVRFRDVAPIWSVATTALFYGTPVLYAIDVVP
ncbi:MAG: ABC transporter permease, partial [Solirubrobacteraceae bacterium]